jgi:hypothetical protein
VVRFGYKKEGGILAAWRPSPHFKRRGVERGGGGPAQARHVEESREGSDTGATHSEGGARRSRNPSAVGRAACGRRGRQGSGVVHVGRVCRR